MDGGSARPTIDSLQAGRAVAAIAVLFHHAVASTVTFAQGAPDWLRVAGSFGYLGVDFFFVLSGFIIFYINSHRQAGWLKRYTTSRLARVYIPYLPVGIVLALAYTLLPTLSAGDREWHWLPTLTLIPGSGEGALIVAWTLQYELAFYAVFAFGMLIGLPGATVIAWGVAAAVCNLAGVDVPKAIAPWMNIMVVEFSFGVLAAMAIARGTRMPAALLGLAAIILFVALGGTDKQRIVFAAAMAFFVVTLVRMETKGAIRTPKLLIFLGAASYSLYLIHNPAGSLSTRFVEGWLALFVLYLVVGFASGIGYHLLFEAPVLQMLRRRGRIESPAAALEGDEGS